MPSVVRWLLGRAVFALVVLWGAATLVFISIQLLPGSAARAIAGGVASYATPQVLATITNQYGLNKPVPVQYLIYLGHLVRGQLGVSYQLGQPVSTLIGSALGPTAALAAGSAAIGFTVALAVAVTTAARPRARAVARLLELSCVSMPSFWVGILLLTAFSFRLHVFPISGGGVRALVLPWITLALPIAALLSNVARDGLERALDQPFALTVRARGAGEWRLRFRHALRHALLPVLTLSGWTLGELLGGVVVVEAVFARAGIGQLLVNAVNGRDFPLIEGIVATTALAFVVINTGLELLYRVVDPRLLLEPS
jgi:peptide/nickel transport system permease protein